MINIISARTIKKCKKSNHNQSDHKDLVNEFMINTELQNYMITLLGYTKISTNGSRHTNWFPWNRFLDVFKTIGYDCEWIELVDLVRNNEKNHFKCWENIFMLKNRYKYHIYFKTKTKLIDMFNNSQMGLV